jgi:SAM-dependent methyltransferase
MEVVIEMAPGDFDALRHQSRSLLAMLGEGCQDGPNANPYTYFPATVTVDGNRLEMSAVRKKGFLGSASLSKPSLKISFDELVPGREFSGVEGLTLNNSKQDPSLLKTCLALKMFRDAGVPASRCSLAHVTLNGADLGIYMNVEPMTKRFLARHFVDNTGNLYEGQLSDLRPGFTATYEKKTNTGDPDRSDLDGLTTALMAADVDLEATLGAYTLAMAPLLGSGGAVYAVDVQKELLHKLSVEAKRAKLHNVHVVWGNVEKLNGSTLAAASVDVVVAANVLFQTVGRYTLALEAKRVLRPGGRVAVVEWADSFNNLGPEASAVVPVEEAKKIFAEAGFKFANDFPAGAHHYGLMFTL